MTLLLWAAAGLLAVYYANYFRCLSRNIACAKQSGLPYYITPVYGMNRVWLVQSWIWLPLLHKLPKSWVWPWLELLDPEWQFRSKRAIFDYAGSNVVLAVAPGRITAYVADAEAISQITTRRNDFPKPIELYRGVDIFGKNVVSTEGSIWRHHRKITSPPFTEKNNHLVWSESLHQATAMVESWSKRTASEAKKPIIDVAAATMRLSLHVISRAGFGRRLLWPHEEMAREKEVGKVPPGHTMTYKDALSILLDNILFAFLLPRWLLRYAPFKATKVAWEALSNWKQYMQEMYDEKTAEVAAGEDNAEGGMDLMGALVRGAGVVQQPPGGKKVAEKGSSVGQLLSDSEILGNAFVFILAGHETAANTLHFSILELACDPSSQRRLQKDLDDIFGSRPTSEWNYDADVPKLFGCLAGATMNEVLRLFPPVVGIPKSVASNSAPQPLVVAGKHVTIPSGAMVTLDTVGAHLDPKNWPVLLDRDQASDTAIAEDLVTFKPERWLLGNSPHFTTGLHKPIMLHESASSETDQSQSASKSAADADLSIASAPDTSPSLFRPSRGAYVPFSEGYRACLGRRFAQVEVLAVLAVVFKDYSVELAVEDILGTNWPFAKGAAKKEAVVAAAAQQSGAGQGVGETATSHAGENDAEQWRWAQTRTDVSRGEWETAVGRVQEALNGKMGTIITLQLRGARVPVRFVKRGEERFKF